MNRRLKVLIAALAVAVLCLSAAIISFRLSGSQTDTSGTDVPADDGGSIELFFENGLWGARKTNGRVLIEPQWAHLRTMSDTVLIARQNNGRTDRYGLIGINGEQLMPFLYKNFSYAGSSNPELWIAEFEENGQIHYHLYREDGTRWSDIAWDECRFEEGILYVSVGKDQLQGIPEKTGIRWTRWYTEYPVGLHELVMEFDEAELEQLPPADTLKRLGESAADFLNYLFVSKKAPDASLISAEDGDEILAEERYRSCRLGKASVSRIQQRVTEGLPSYFVQIQVSYQRQISENTSVYINTAMELIMTRNSAGNFTFGGFTDTQMNAAGGDLIN